MKSLKAEKKCASSLQYWIDVVIIIGLLYLPLSILTLDWLMLNHLPTGGDTASHVFYAKQFCQYFPQAGLTQWLPEVFGGLPFLSYYFPLPFILIFLFDQVLPFALAFKFAVFLPAIILPAFVYAISIDFLKLSRFAGFFASISSLALILHEQHSIWGGNLLSILSGEFAYSYGMLLSFLTLTVWVKAMRGQYLWLLAGLLEAATGFAHGYALLITGFSSFFILLGGNYKQGLKFLCLSHGLAFCLLAGWLWPLLAMHNLTIANDSSFMSINWLDYIPKSFWPVIIYGFAGIILFCFSDLRKFTSSLYKNALAFFLAATTLALTLWLCANRIGLADIRFYPYVLLFSSILCGWLIGEAFHTLARSYRLIINISTVVLATGLLNWLITQVEKAPQWSEWNHSGYEDKQAWQQLSHLFPMLSGKLDSPRLLFEHDPANNDLGSTRALEALPLFLHQRPVLEGLYMESALLAPVIYQLQSEVSRAPSSPLTRFPSGSLDINAAATHMQLLYSNEILTRSLESQTAIESSSLFKTIAIAPPFKAYRLKSFSSKLVSLVDLPLASASRQHWMKHSFDWFKSFPNINVWPVYTEDKNLENRPFKTTQTATISKLQLEREKITFTTNQLHQPHLIKIAYHPRWKLRSKGQIYLAAPGYLLVIPESNPVQLVYGKTLTGIVGLWVSIATAGLIILFFLFKFTHFYSLTKFDFCYKKALVIWLGLMLLIASYSYYSDPERIYKQGWQQMNNGDYIAAARYFDRIIDKRRGRAQQEEVLFWAAKAYEQAGNQKLAMQRYQKLLDEFNGYWLPESIYTLAELHERGGNQKKAHHLRVLLKTRFTKNRFSLALDPE